VTATKPVRVEARLRSPQALHDAMEFAGMTIRELAAACGNPRHRSSIGHLSSGSRSHCSVHLAGRMERVLRVPRYSLFDLRVTTTDNVVTSHKVRSTAA
jgi:hypothetical protein